VFLLVTLFGDDGVCGEERLSFLLRIESGISRYGLPVCDVIATVPLLVWSAVASTRFDSLQARAFSLHSFWRCLDRAIASIWRSRST
jgi:hypothetical protein